MQPPGWCASSHAEGVEVTVVLPDYGTYDAGLGEDEPLDMPGWVGITTIRRGSLGGGVPLVAVRTPADRAPPSLQRRRRAAAGTTTTSGSWRSRRRWPELAATMRPGRAPHQRLAHRRLPGHGASGHVPRCSPSTTSPTRGWPTAGGWGCSATDSEAYEWHGTVNPMSGAIALADLVVAVSPNYVHEIRRPESGFGLDGPLRDEGRRPGGHPQRHRHRPSGTRRPTPTSPRRSTPRTWPGRRPRGAT